MPLFFEAATLSRMRSPVISLKLGEREQHVEGQTSHAGDGVEGLRNRDERDVVFVEQLDELGEVGQ
jgi:hypothetical protein